MYNLIQLGIQTVSVNQLNSSLSCSGNGICSVSGDPHYTTFDKHTHHYMGACSYTLTKPCNASSGMPYFTVDTQNEHRGSNKKISYVRAVVINVDGVTFILGKGRKVQVCYLTETTTTGAVVLLARLLSVVCQISRELRINISLCVSGQWDGGCPTCHLHQWS